MLSRETAPSIICKEATFLMISIKREKWANGGAIGETKGINPRVESSTSGVLIAPGYTTRENTPLKRVKMLGFTAGISIYLAHML